MERKISTVLMMACKTDRRRASAGPRRRAGGRHVLITRTALLIVSVAVAASTSWTAAWTNIGPYAAYAWSLAIDPQDPNVLYCGTDGAGLFKSANAALTWMPARDGLHSILDRVYSVAVSPFSPKLVFAGVDGAVGRSTDAGMHWKKVRFRPDFSYAKTVGIACDPTRASVVYASVLDNPSLYVSRDAGQTWTPPTVEDGVWIWDFSTTNGAPGLVYAAASFAGVYRSEDFGKTWTRTSNGLNPLRPVHHVEVSPLDPDTVYATDGSLYVSRDRGQQWTRLNTLQGVVELIRVQVQARGNPNPGRPMLIAVTGNADVQISYDEGVTWVKADYGLPGAGTEYGLDLVLDLASPQGMPWIMYATTTRGVYKTVDGGAGWVRSYYGITNYRIAYSGMLIDPERPGWVVEAGGRSGDSVNGEIRVTSDRGRTWGQAMNGIAFESVEFRAMRRGTDPGSPIYVAANKNTPDNPVVYRSDDDARSWNQTFLLKKGFTRLRFFEMDPGSSATLYVGVNPIEDDERGANAIFRSFDGGRKWTPLGKIRERIWCLGIDPTDRSVLYVGSDESRLLKSTDSGGTWRPVSGGLPTSWFWVLDLLVDPELPSVVYANLYPQGLYRSTDRGETWESIGAELGGAGVITALAVDPNDSRVVYVGGSEDVLLYKSENRGNTWRSISKGLTGGVVSILINPRDPRNIYVGTFGSGIFVTTTGGE